MWYGQKRKNKKGFVLTEVRGAMILAKKVFRRLVVLHLDLCCKEGGNKLAKKGKAACIAEEGKVGGGEKSSLQHFPKCEIVRNLRRERELGKGSCSTDREAHPISLDWW